MNLTTTDSQATGFPLVIATQIQQPTARLQLRNTHGQVIQQWLVKSNKCTLGSAVSCSLRCELPGVAPYHALLVIGARQIFIRALAPKLTRDGQPFNELLLTNEDSHFEIAGHRFELSRANASTEVEPAARAEASSPQRIKFTLARPFELRNRAQLPPITHINAVQQAADMISDGRSSGDPKWVAQMIQAALQPLECQLHNLAEPLNELQRESRNQRRLRKRRALRKRKAAAEQSAMVSEDPLQHTHTQPAEQAQLSEQVEAIVVKHSAAMEVLTERVSEVNQQLHAIERIVAEQRQADQASAEPRVAADSPQLTLQSAAIEQLQHSVVSVSTTLERLQAEQVTVREDDQQWKDSLQSQLGNLAQVIEGLSASVTEVHHIALTAAAQPVAETHPDYWAETTVDSQPISNWQPDANLQADIDIDAATAADPLLVSLPSTPDAWGLATDDLTRQTFEPEQPMWSAVEPVDAAAELSAKSAADFADEIESSNDAGSALLPEISQPAHDQEQPMWAAIEREDAITGQATETEASGGTAHPDSTSLPSWWADEESERGLQAESASEYSAELDEGQYATRDAQRASDTDERFFESVSEIDERVFESISDCDDRISEGVPAAQRQSAGEQTSDVGQSSEEFFGLAQLDLEEHLREAEPLPHALVTSDQEADAAARELLLDESNASLVAIENQAIDALEGQTLEEHLIGFGQSDDFRAEAVLSQPGGDVSTVGNAFENSANHPENTIQNATDIPAESPAENPAENSAENSAESTIDNAAEMDDADSIEEYMRKLLARMRGVPEEEIAPQPVNKPIEKNVHSYASPTAASTGSGRSDPSAADQPTSNYNSRTVASGLDVTEPFDPEKYMPRALAPERSNSLAAMRELANSSARTAIHKSTRQRHVSSIALKSVIACVGLVVGMVLLAINGLSLNIGLVATVASFLVAIIWGYDSISSIRPMLQNGLILQPQAGSPPTSTDEQD